MKFKKPCLDCGSLSFENRCPRHLSEYNARRAERFNLPSRKEKKRNLYNSDYIKRSKPIRETATNCYLCGEPFTDRKQIQIDHCYPSMPDTPLAPAHASCNRNKSDKDYSPKDFPNGLTVARHYLGNLDKYL